MAWPVVGLFILTMMMLVQARGALTVQPSANQGFDVYTDGVLVAPIRLAANAAILTNQVVPEGTGLRFSGLRASDPLAVTFGTDDFISVTLPAPDDTNTEFIELV